MCYFESQKSTAEGLATPLTAPVLETPIVSTTGNVYQFQFIGSNRQYALTLDYIVELSDSSSFPANSSDTYSFTLQKIGASGSTTTGTTYTSPSVTISGKASLLPANVQAAQIIYWRVGARNHWDVPGPVPDALSGERYIFSTPSQISRSTASGTVLHKKKK